MSHACTHAHARAHTTYVRHILRITYMHVCIVVVFVNGIMLIIYEYYMYMCTQLTTLYVIYVHRVDLDWNSDTGFLAGHQVCAYVCLSLSAYLCVHIFSTYFPCVCVCVCVMCDLYVLPFMCICIVCLRRHSIHKCHVIKCVQLCLYIHITLVCFTGITA